MFLRNLVKLYNSISVRNFRILPSNSREDQNKKVFTAFWFYLSPADLLLPGGKHLPKN